MRHIDFPLDVKDVGDDGAIEGLAATYNNVDFGGDVILPGAFTKTLRGRKSLPMLLYHDQRSPVGVWDEFEDGAKGLALKGRIVVSTAAGAEAHALAKAGALSGLSIGYSAVKEKITDRARELSEIALYEVSLVSIGMNEKARVTSVKDSNGVGRLPSLSEFEAFLREEGGFSKTQATAIAGKGLAQLLRGEPGGDPEVDFWSAMAAQFRA